MKETREAETMQPTRKGETVPKPRDHRSTHNAIRIISALAIAALLGTGCGNTENTKLTAPEVAETPKAVEAETWEPETVTPQEAASDHGHEGHDHGPDGHTH